MADTKLTMCNRCGGPMTGQNVLDGKHRHLIDCITFLKSQCAARCELPGGNSSSVTYPPDLTEELRLLREENAALRKDKERLDWLETSWDEDTESPIIRLDQGFIPERSGSWKRGMLLREAIDAGVEHDAAITAEKETRG